MALYTTYGSVRGQCGHWHQHEHTARACLQHDRAACTAHGGYSDRDIYPVNADGYLVRQDGRYLGSPGRGIKIAGAK